MQMIIWFVIPAVSTSSANHTNNTLSMIVLIQYIPRVYLIISLNSKIVKASGVVTRTAWAGAAYNLLLYTLASHVCSCIFFSFLKRNVNYCIIFNHEKTSRLINFL